ncbi:MAG TPA: SLBB domain-containing protein [Kiritimatiellia bacterium]|nr:SLBB domain-containing protein [Kiritimatiellia bacterium]
MNGGKFSRAAWGRRAAVFAAVCGVAVSAAGQAPARMDSAARRILAGDRLNISVREQPDMNKTYAVAGDGSIDFAFAGRVVIAELTSDEAARKLESVLEEKYFKEANVSISIANFVEGDVLVTGAVRNPGSLPFRGDSILTLVEAISRSGGLAENAAGDRVRILRWTPGGSMERQSIEVDVQGMLDTMDFSKDQYLRPRDIIIVPSRGAEEGRNEFLALGEVRSPGFHPYSEGLDVVKTVTLVGGLGEFADWSGARILRPKPSGEYAIVPLDLNRLFSAADMAMNLPLQKGDIFFVPSVRNLVRAQVYLLGEVNRPGAVSLSAGPGATVARLILDQGGATQFANLGKVQIQRTAPDGSKKALVVDVGRILKEGSFEEDVPLQEGDVVIVPEKGLLGL